MGNQDNVADVRLVKDQALTVGSYHFKDSLSALQASQRDGS